jgi:hypothetical protein
VFAFVPFASIIRKQQNNENREYRDVDSFFSILSCNTSLILVAEWRDTVFEAQL